MIRRVLARVLDPSRKLDYAFAAMIGTAPSAVALLAGNHRSLPYQDLIYQGFWEDPAWVTYIGFVPLALFLFRWAMARIAPIGSPDLPEELPGVVELVRSDAGRRATYVALRDRILWPGNLVVTALLIATFSVVDVRNALGVYLAGLPSDYAGEQDWAIMFVTGHVDKWANAAQLSVAYAAQFVILSIPVLFLVLMIQHNLFFLKRVYQRRRVPPSEAENYVVVDLEDPDFCFGFRKANAAFNVQVSCLYLAGLILIFSRHSRVGEASRAATHILTGWFPGSGPWDGSSPVWSELLADFGQWVAVLGWLGGLLIISAPGWVKLLPLIPFTGAGRAAATVTGYLREFLPDSDWPFDREPTRNEVDQLASRFAQNHFWPTGDNRAARLFSIAILAGLWLVFPVWFGEYGSGRTLGAFALLSVSALVITALFFAFLVYWIWGVDARLVRSVPKAAPREAGEPGLPLGDRFNGYVFISYRRTDSSPWAGRLRDSLSKRCFPGRIFRDIEEVPYGKDFVDAIDEALATADVALILIGPQWLDAADEGGSRRLDDPNDWVRIEIARALSRGDLPVIPVRLGGASVPASGSLPEPLRPLTRLNAIELTEERWDYDVGRLVDAMKNAVVNAG